MLSDVLQEKSGSFLVRRGEGVGRGRRTTVMAFVYRERRRSSEYVYAGGHHQQVDEVSLLAIFVYCSSP